MSGYRVPVALALFLMSVFCLSASTLRFGYEGPNIDEAASWMTGTGGHRGVGGVLEIAAYAPSAWVKHRLLPPEKLNSIKNIAYSFVQPLVATLICLFFYGFALDIFRKERIAATLTLILGLGTMAWPYSKFGMENHQSLWTLASCWMLLRYVRDSNVRSAVLFAVSMGLLALTKATGVVHCAAIFGIGCWFVFARRLWNRQGFCRHALVAGGIGVAALAVLFLTNHARFDAILLGNRYQASTELSTQYFWESLFGSLIGPGKSVFIFSPPLLIALWYYCRMFRANLELKPVYVGLAVLALWYFLFSNHFNDETWGPRRLHWALPFLLLPVGCWLEAWRDQKCFARVAGCLVLIAGIGVQLLAIAFDYTAHAFVMGRHDVYSIEHNVWLPEMNGIRFNAHLLRSNLAGPHDYVVEWHYVPWDAPDVRPEPLAFNVEKYDHFDFWWLHERNAWGAGQYWFKQASSLVFFFWAAILIASAVLLARALRCQRTPTSAGAPTP